MGKTGIKGTAKHKNHAKSHEEELHLKRDRKKTQELKTLGISVLKKDLGLPNLTRQKQKFQAELDRKKAAGRAIPTAKEVNYESAAQLAAMEVSDLDPQTASLSLPTKDPTRRAFYKDLIQIIEAADILLEVVDARDPERSRSRELECKVQSYGKRLVVVMNKIDLVPANVALAWQEHIALSFPCVLFRCNTQTQRTHLAAATVFKKSLETSVGQEILETNKAVGADALMQLVKNYMRSEGTDVKTAVTIGVVGYPNVGKSSVINSLKRSKVVGVSSTPGFTRNLQEVELESLVKIIDCPGIVFEASDGTPENVLRNIVKIENLEDSMTPVQAVLEKVPGDVLQKLYDIPGFSTVQTFLAHVARRRGKMKKKGIPDLEASGRIVLHDWVEGAIPYYTPPPQVSMVVD